jgi:hypothetical protein
MDLSGLLVTGITRIQGHSRFGLNGRLCAGTQYENKCQIDATKLEVRWMDTY